MNITHSDFCKLMAQLVNGNASRPTTIYMGLRTDSPADADTLSTVSGNEVGATTANGYARQSITVNTTNLVDAASGNGWQLTLAQQTITFTGVPSPNAATSWFLTDQSSGYTGKLYASGALNPATVSTTLQGAASSGQAIIVVPNTIAANLSGVSGAQDWLIVGIIGGNYGVNFERKQIAVGGVGAAGSGGGSNTNITLSSNLANSHVSGEPVTRDGTVRTYSSGISEIVIPVIAINSLY